MLIIVFASNTWTYSEVIEYQIDLYHAYGIFSLELVFIITCVATAAMAAQSVISLLLLSCSLQIRLFYYVLAASSIVILHNQSCWNKVSFVVWNGKLSRLKIKSEWYIDDEMKHSYYNCFV